MNYRALGHSGLKVSEVSLGCMAFGRWIDEQTSQQVFDAAFDAGITLFDTADIYGRGMDTKDPKQTGESEEMLGRIMKEKRKDILLATKVNGRVGLNSNDVGLSRYHIHRAVEKSLKRLQTDVIDLYQVHRFDQDTPLEETLGALDDLVKQGKIRYLGCSNFAAWQIAKSHRLSEKNKWNHFISVQPPYSLLVRDIERELLPFGVSEGVGAIVYSPLARGLLTGKYKDGKSRPAGSRAVMKDQALLRLLEEPHVMKRLEALEEYSSKRGWPIVGLAFAWVLKQRGITSAILGASRPEQIQDVMESKAIYLTDDDMKEIANL